MIIKLRIFLFIIFSLDSSFSFFNSFPFFIILFLIDLLKLILIYWLIFLLFLLLLLLLLLLLFLLLMWLLIFWWTNFKGLILFFFLNLFKNLFFHLWVSIICPLYPFLPFFDFPYFFRKVIHLAFNNSSYFCFVFVFLEYCIHLNQITFIDPSIAKFAEPFPRYKHFLLAIFDSLAQDLVDFKKDFQTPSVWGSGGWSWCIIFALNLYRFLDNWSILFSAPSLSLAGDFIHLGCILCFLCLVAIIWH